MNLTKRRCLFIFLLLNISVLFISLIYNFFFEKGMISDCVFNKTFGLYCPGCGGSRSLFALLHFDLLTSFIYYPPIIFSALILLFIDIKMTVFLFKRNDTRLKINGKIFIFIPVSIILNFIIKNILLAFKIRFF